MNQYLTYAKNKFFEDRCNMQKQMGFLAFFLIMLVLFRSDLALLLIIYLVVFPISYLIACAVRFNRRREKSG